MIYNKQTKENFVTMIEELQKDFTNQQENYGWKFKSNLENLGEVNCFLITNKFFTTKLSFDPQSKYIVRATISDIDIDRILKLKEGLS